ncbi:MAG: flavodoxin family protein, partial [Pyrinomonadaceae bacterium]
MVHIAIVYHSGFGHTTVQAKAVERGAQLVPGVETSLIFVDEIDQHWEKLDAADAIIFGSPTYMGSASAPFKTFMDKSSTRWLVLKWQNKIASGFTNSGSASGDKLNTLVQLAIFAAQHGMI